MTVEGVLLAFRQTVLGFLDTTMEVPPPPHTHLERQSRGVMCTTVTGLSAPPAVQLPRACGQFGLSVVDRVCSPIQKELFNDAQCVLTHQDQQ